MLILENSAKSISNTSKDVIDPTNPDSLIVDIINHRHSMKLALATGHQQPHFELNEIILQAEESQF